MAPQPAAQLLSFICAQSSALQTHKPHPAGLELGGSAVSAIDQISV